MKKKTKKYHFISVPVGGLTYEIIFEDLNSKREKGIMGECRFDDRTIVLDVNFANDEELCFTLFHELIHAAIEAALTDVKVKDVQDDAFIHPFSRLLWGSLQNVGLINAWWNKKKRKAKS